MKMEHWSASSANSPNRLRETTTGELLPPRSFIHPTASIHSSQCQRVKGGGIQRTWALQLHLDSDAPSWTAGVFGVFYFCFVCALLLSCHRRTCAQAFFFFPHNAVVLWLLIKDTAHTIPLSLCLLPMTHIPPSTQHGLVPKASTLYLFFVNTFTSHVEKVSPSSDPRVFCFVFVLLSRIFRAQFGLYFFCMKPCREGEGRRWNCWVVFAATCKCLNPPTSLHLCTSLYLLFYFCSHRHTLYALKDEPGQWTTALYSLQS